MKKSIKEEVQNMDTDRLNIAREAATKFLKFTKEDLELIKEGATCLAKTTRNLFKELRRNKSNLLYAIEKTNIDDLFKSIQKLKEAGVFEKLEQMTPSVRRDKKEHKEFQELINNITSPETPEGLKASLKDHLSKDPNSLENLNSELKTFLKKENRKVVKIFTNRKLIGAAFEAINSRAGKNFVKVLADKRSSKNKIARAYARLAFTAVRKYFLHTKKLVEAAVILDRVQKEDYKRKLNDPKIRAQEMINIFNKSPHNELERLINNHNLGRGAPPRIKHNVNIQLNGRGR
ncbi:MAG: F0F1 ATP synthase subunit delta [Rickettsiales bacterium]|nr:F0F1 ATP synthase subunit delta [Rickettsiales bacterium]